MLNKLLIRSMSEGINRLYNSIKPLLKDYQIFDERTTRQNTKILQRNFERNHGNKFDRRSIKYGMKRRNMTR